MNLKGTPAFRELRLAGAIAYCFVSKLLKSPGGRADSALSARAAYITLGKDY
jgi:hypothetical protein